MAILESIAAANAAYSVIRTALGNGKETAGVISSIGKFLAAEEDIKDAVNKRKTVRLQQSLAAMRVTGKSSKPLKTLDKSALS